MREAWAANSRRRFLGTAGVSAMGFATTARRAMPADWEANQGSITDVRGIAVGHYTEPRRPTGCTVLLFNEPFVAGVDVRGSAPGTRETDLLQPINTVERVNAIVLSGGSAYGLDAASGVMRFLEERGVGFHVGNAVVPIVPAAILFDLQIGNPKIHPSADSGYLACQAATHSNIAEGSVGAGAGATVGKLFGTQLGMKGGVGTASRKVGQSGLIVAAIVAVNAAGDIVERRQGRILVGARHPDGSRFIDCMAQLNRGVLPGAKIGSNTTIGVVATNAQLTKTQATKVAQMAHDGLARTIQPVHTSYDGDTIFAVARGDYRGTVDVSAIGAIGAEVLATAVNRAILTATGIPGYPAYKEIDWAER
jgi:L-aminopeptidase/D-esterase-like protein